MASALLVLMGFAAIAVDLSAGWTERRQDQNAGDFAAMAAVQFARGSTSVAGAANNGAAEAISVANASLDTPFTAAEWAACTDPDRPSSFSVVSGLSPCISFTPGLQEARVRTPTADVATTFGRVLGAASIDVDAAAEAKGTLGTPGGILPFGIPVASAGDSLVCLKTGSQPQSLPPCDGPAEGNFGYLDISLYGNADLNTPQTCGNAQRQAKIVSNIAVGVDHPLQEYGADGTTQVRNDHDYCPIFNSLPNELPGETGNAYGPALDPGLRDGNYGNPGRIAQGSNRISVVTGTPQLDNTPLWEFLNSGNTNLPASCSGVDTTAEMQQCMDDWVPADGVLFRDTVIDNSRFAFVPEFFVNPGPGQQDYLIKDFRAVYLHTTYFSCNANRCRIVFEPGVPSSGACANGQGTSCGFPQAGNRAIESLNAFLMVDSMLSEEVQKLFPPGEGSVSYSLTR